MGTFRFIAECVSEAIASLRDLIFPPKAPDPWRTKPSTKKPIFGVPDDFSETEMDLDVSPLVPHKIEKPIEEID